MDKRRNLIVHSQKSFCRIRSKCLLLVWYRLEPAWYFSLSSLVGNCHIWESLSLVGIFIVRDPSLAKVSRMARWRYESTTGLNNLACYPAWRLKLELPKHILVGWYFGVLGEMILHDSYPITCKSLPGLTQRQLQRIDRMSFPEAFQPINQSLLSPCPIH